MKHIYKYLIWVAFFALLITNIFVFLHSIKLSDEINRYEKEIAALHEENLQLSNKIYSVDSLQHAASLAASLNFTKKAQPVYLDDLKYALNR